MTGGSVADGVYVLQSHAAYGTASGPSTIRRITLQVNGATWDLVDEEDGVTHRARLTVALGPGSTVNGSAACNDGVHLLPIQYSASASMISVLDANNAVSVFVP